MDLNPVNTMFSGMLTALKDDVGNGPLNQLLIERLPYDTLEECQFANMVEFLMNKNRVYSEAKMGLYRSIANSHSTTIALESFSEYSAKAHDLVDETIKFMKVKVQESCNNLKEYIESDQLLNDLKRDITQEMRSYQVDYQDMYRYTLFEEVPNPSALENFNASLFTDLFEPQVEDLSVESIRNSLANIDLEQTYRAFRAALLNSSEPIDEKNFAHELHKVFRNGKDCPERIHLENSDVLTIAQVWYNFRSVIEKPMMDHLRRVDSACESILERVEAICRDNNGMTIQAFTKLLPGDVLSKSIDSVDVDQAGVPMSADMLFSVDRYCNLKLDQLQKFLDLTCMAYMAKMDAITECVNQSRIILLDAARVLENPEQYYDARLGPVRKKVDPVKDILQGGDMS